ncbi:MAG TPA: 4-hydroxythreonine-4-phosphate dehydrogenase PdxA [Candidatus Dormibacteraeota bacterium]|nr:4-hydroxythreonine-4-phosphate dehydrogenase PdxA [Candidatus Dormibacteraeota bacterium]
MARGIIAVTMGDPAGVGAEIVMAALAVEEHRVVVIGDAGRLKLAGELLPRGGPRLRRVAAPAEARFEPGVVNVVDLANVPADLPWGELSAEAGRAGYAYLEHAARLALDGEVTAVCTAPINKEAWRRAGVPHLGHTEALAAICGTGCFAMMLVNRRLRVVHQSTHVSLAEAVMLATTQRCLECIRLAAAFLREHAGIAEPRIAVAGINPHAGENGLLGAEDAAELAPAVELAREEGIQSSGPWPPDTVFLRGSEGEFDAVIAAHHDQGHIPIKLLGLDTGVNVTIGLPIVRTSVDHGTAFDIAGTGRARPANLLAALRLAEDLGTGQG